MSALKFFIGCCLVLPGLVSVSAFPVAAPSPLLRLRVRDRYLTSRSGNSTSSTSPVSNATIESTLVRPAQFSRTAYCGAAVASWDCGPPCDALPGVEVLTVGGDGGLIPFCASRFCLAHEFALLRSQLTSGWAKHRFHRSRSCYTKHRGSTSRHQRVRHVRISSFLPAGLLRISDPVT